MGRVVVLTKDQYDEIESLYKSRTKMGELCKKFNVSHSYMLKTLKNMGIYCSETLYFSEEEYEEIDSMYSSGVSVEKIALKYRVDRHALSNIMKRRGINVNRRTSYTEGELLEMSELYDNGISIYDISKKFKTSIEICSREMRNYGISIRKGPWDYLNKLEITEDRINTICNMYDKRESLDNISKSVGLGVHRCRAILEKCGIEIRNTTRKYSVDEGYFDVIDSEDKAYWLGFLAADGSNQKNRTTRLKLKRGDILQIEKFKECLNSQHPIRLEETILNGRVYEESAINIGSTRLAKRLTELGITPNKTFTIKPCDVISEDLERHFWRGAVDGDGWIYSKVYGNRIGLCGSKLMVEGFLYFIRKNGIETEASISPEGNIYKFELSGRGKPLELADLLYRESNIYLDRKYETYLEMEKSMA